MVEARARLVSLGQHRLVLNRRDKWTLLVGEVDDTKLLSRRGRPQRLCSSWDAKSVKEARIYLHTRTLRHRSRRNGHDSWKYLIEGRDGYASAQRCFALARLQCKAPRKVPEGLLQHTTVQLARPGRSLPPSRCFRGAPAASRTSIRAGEGPGSALATGEAREGLGKDCSTARGA